MTKEDDKRHRGGQPGNRNASKHGYSSPIINSGMEMDIMAAKTVKGLDSEIALARVRIASILKHDPNNFNALLRALNLLERLVRTQYQLPGSDRHPPAGPIETMDRFLNRLTGGHNK